MSCKPTEIQIDYRNSKNRLYGLIFGLIIISSLVIYQIVESSDSIIEIRFSEDFTIDENSLITGFNSSSLSEENISLVDISYKILTFQLVFNSKNYPFTVLSYQDKINFFVHPHPEVLYANVVNEIQIKRSTAFQRSFGNTFNKDIIELNKGKSFKFRLPRDLVFSHIEMRIGNTFNTYVENANETLDGTIYFEKMIYGLVDLNLAQSSTSFNKMIITINNITFNEEAYHIIQEFPTETDQQRLLDFDDMPDNFDLYFNISLTRGAIFEDIFDSSIK